MLHNGLLGVLMKSGHKTLFMSCRLSDKFMKAVIINDSYIGIKCQHILFVYIPKVRYLINTFTNHPNKGLLVIFPSLMWCDRHTKHKQRFQGFLIWSYNYLVNWTLDDLIKGSQFRQILEWVFTAHCWMYNRSKAHVSFPKKGSFGSITPSWSRRFKSLWHFDELCCYRRDTTSCRVAALVKFCFFTE